MTNKITNDLVNKIEAILFYIGEPVSINSLTKILDISKKEVVGAIKELGTILENRGVRIVEHDDEIVMVTAPELSSVIEKMVKEERERDLGRAGIETLSIIAYKGLVSKKDIEYIRGVNSQYALRSLLLRGLITRENSKTDERMVVYNITGDTLRFLGLTSVSDLPQYREMQKQLEIKEENAEESEIEDEN